MTPKYPEIEVQLTGEDGNALAIVGRVRKALRREGVTEEQIIEFMDEALSGNYDNLIQTVNEWVEVL
jgi:hypothetical protein